jgi:hypothetical protein
VETRRKQPNNTTTKNTSTLDMIIAGPLWPSRVAYTDVLRCHTVPSEVQTEEITFVEIRTSVVFLNDLHLQQVILGPRVQLIYCCGDVQHHACHVCLGHVQNSVELFQQNCVPRGYCSQQGIIHDAVLLIGDIKLHVRYGMCPRSYA